MTNNGFESMKYEDTEQYKLTKYFMTNYRNVIDRLMNGN